MSAGVVFNVLNSYVKSGMNVVSIVGERSRVFLQKLLAYNKLSKRIKHLELN